VVPRVRLSLGAGSEHDVLCTGSTAKVESNQTSALEIRSRRPCNVQDCDSLASMNSLFFSWLSRSSIFLMNGAVEGRSLDATDWTEDEVLGSSTLDFLGGEAIEDGEAGEGVVPLVRFDMAEARMRVVVRRRMVDS
jgi:hypothetical protein